MIRSPYLIAFVLAGVGTTMVACTADTAPEEPVGAASALTATGAHSMQPGKPPPPTNDPSAPVSGLPPRPRLENPSGGPVISNVKIVAVMWGSNVDATVNAKIGAFYSRITNSAHLDWLSEYSTPSQRIGRGSLAGKYTITPARPALTLSETDITTELAAQIDSGALPAQDANTLYIVHLPPGVRTTFVGLTAVEMSCVDFCAYHNSSDVAARSGTRHLRYAIVPDFGPGSGCDLSCGPDPVAFNNVTMAVSHEMVEAITDPDPLKGWTDPAYVEIGDICAEQEETVIVGGASYVIQKEWSNSAAACVVANPVGFSQPAPGCAKEIAAGPTPYVLGCDTDAYGDFHVYSWNGSAWAPENGYGRHIAVSPEGTPWIIDHAGTVKRYQRLSNTFNTIGVAGCATSIGVGPNDAAWIIGCGNVGTGGNGVFRLSGLYGSWQQQPGAATQISVTPGGTPWVINALGTIYAWNGSVFATLKVPACATAIAASEKDTWVVGCSSAGAGGNGIYGYRNYFPGWDQVNGQAVKIAVQTDGTPWVVNAQGSIFVMDHTL